MLLSLWVHFLTTRKSTCCVYYWYRVHLNLHATYSFINRSHKAASNVHVWAKQLPIMLSILAILSITASCPKVVDKWRTDQHKGVSMSMSNKCITIFKRSLLLIWIYFKTLHMLALACLCVNPTNLYIIRERKYHPTLLPVFKAKVFKVKGYSGVGRCAKVKQNCVRELIHNPNHWVGKNVMEYDMLLFPVHKPQHWCWVVSVSAF